jgi:hypothetical protein
VELNYDIMVNIELIAMEGESEGNGRMDVSKDQARSKRQKGAYKQMSCPEPSA